MGHCVVPMGMLVFVVMVMVVRLVVVIVMMRSGASADCAHVTTPPRF